MKEILIVGNRTFEVAGPLTPELKAQVMQQIMNKVQGGGGGCPSCASAKSAGGGMLKLGTATCGGPYIQNTSQPLTGSVISGGTAPFTYTWTITPPTGSPVTLTGASQTYMFAQAGIYTINLSVRDSCPAGGLTDSASCSVTITAACVNPVCNINIAPTPCTFSACQPQYISGNSACAAMGGTCISSNCGGGCIDWPAAPGACGCIAQCRLSSPSCTPPPLPLTHSSTMEEFK